MVHPLKLTPHNLVRFCGTGYWSTIFDVIRLLQQIFIWQIQTRNCTYRIGKLRKLLRCINSSEAREDFLKDHVLDVASYTIHGTFTVVCLKIMPYDVNILSNFCKQRKTYLDRNRAAHLSEKIWIVSISFSILDHRNYQKVYTRYRCHS